MRIKYGSFKRRLTDIHILLAFLLFFGMSLGLVAQRGIVNNTIQKTMSLPNFFAYIHPLVQAHGVGKIARAIHAFAYDKDEEVLKGIIEHKDWPLTRDDKILLLTAFAILYKNDPLKQSKILNFISRYADYFSPGEPLLYVLTHQGAYEEDILKQEIPLLLRWVQQVKNTGGASFITQAPEKALLYAVEEDDLGTFRQMIDHGVPLNSSLATNLAWKVVEGQKNSGFIAVLEKVGANINSSRGPYTLLMRAILNKNQPMTAQLLKLRADPNLIIDKTVGSPLQIILSESMKAKEEDRLGDIKVYNKLDEMLRNYGARELRFSLSL